MTTPSDRPTPVPPFGIGAGRPPGAAASGAGTSWWRPASAGLDSPSPVVSAEPSSRLPFAALVVFTVLLFLSPQSFFPALQPLRLPFVAGCLALASYFLHQFSHGGPLTVRVRELGFLAGLLAWAVITIPWSLWPGGSNDTILDVYLKSLVVFFLIVNLVTTPARLRRMAWLLTLLSIPVAFTALVNFHAGVYMPGGNDRILGYAAALTENPNDLALLLAVFLPLSGGLLAGERRSVARAALALIMLGDIAAIVVTYSRSGFIILAATTAMLLWKIALRRGHALVAMVVIAAFVCVPLLPGGYLDRVGTSFDIDSDTTGSSEARWQLTQASMDYLAKHPVVAAGIGAGVLALNEELGPQWHQVHNTYLEYAIELGLPGLILFLAMLASALNGSRIIGRRLRAAAAPAALRSLNDGIQVSLIAFAVGALFSPGAYGWVLHYALGMAVASRIAFAAWGTPAARDLGRTP
jgi:O-antigen ligase